MSVITVWKSDADGKIFEDKKKYQNHLRKLARVRRTRRQLEINEALQNAVWNELYEREQSIDQWADMVVEHQDLFWAEAARGDPYDWAIVGKTRKGVVCPVPRLLGFTQFSLRWSDNVGNTHSAPHNGVENFMGHEDKPRGYPGWQGRAEWMVAWPKEWDGYYLGGDLFSAGDTGRQRAHTGTGGGGGMRWNEDYKCHVMTHGYEFKIYAADWPGLARYRNKRVMWDRLANREFA